MIGTSTHKPVAPTNDFPNQQVYSPVYMCVVKNVKMRVKTSPGCLQGEMSSKLSFRR